MLTHARVVGRIQGAIVAASLLAAAPVPSAGAAEMHGAPTFEQPQARMQVTSAVELTEASVAQRAQTRVLRVPVGQRLNHAPVVRTEVGSPLKLVVPGLVPIGTYSVKVKTYGERQRMRSADGYAAIGSIKVNRFGQAQLPVFTPTQAGNIVIAIVARTGETAYAKVKVK